MPVASLLVSRSAFVEARASLRVGESFETAPAPRIDLDESQVAATVVGSCEAFLPRPSFWAGVLHYGDGVKNPSHFLVR